MLATILALVMALGLCSVSWATESETAAATIGTTTYRSLADAVAEAKTGDTITLGAGVADLETLAKVSDGRSLTFVGAGMDQTTLKYGNEYKAGHSDAGGVGCYVFDGAGKITFKDVTLEDKYAADNSSDYYRGFVRPASMSFKRCKFTKVISLFGKGAVNFKDCSFVSTYTKCFNMKCYAGTSFTFDGCSFESPYGFIDAYRQNTLDGALDIMINNCTFTGTGSSPASKPAVRLCDYTNSAEGGAWNVYFTGENTVTNIAEDNRTDTSLYGCRHYDDYEPLMGVVYVDGVKVWANGAAVSGTATGVTASTTKATGEDGVATGTNTNVNGTLTAADASNATVKVDAVLKSDGEPVTTVKTAAVTISGDTMQSLSAAANSSNQTIGSVAIETNVGTLTIDAGALKTMSDKAAGQAVVLEIKDTTETLSDKPEASIKVYEVNAYVVSGNDQTPVFSGDGLTGSVTVSVPYTAASGKTPVVYYVVGQTTTNMNASYANGYLVWTTPHFSVYHVEEVTASTPSTGGYYYHPTTDTKADEAKGSPKTFDAGIGIYAVTAVLSVTGMAWTAKKRH